MLCFALNMAVLLLDSGRVMNRSRKIVLCAGHRRMSTPDERATPPGAAGGRVTLSQ